ncbi:L-cystine transporter, partial [Pseudoalteromonas sp. S3173]
MALAVLLMFALFVGLLFAIYLVSQKSSSLSRTVLVGLVMGSAVGLALHFLFAYSPDCIKEILSWVSVVGKGYVCLLKL